MYNVYKDGEKVATTENNTFQLDGLEADTEYEIGVSQVIDGRESDVTAIKVRTLPKEVSDLTVPEIKQVLDERGVEYTSDMRKADLLKLLT